MEKIFEFDFLSILISTLYFGLIMSLLILLLSYGNKVKKNAVSSLFIGVTLYYAFFLLNHVVSFKSIPPDSIYYANIIKDYWNNYDSWSEGVRLYALINIIPFQLSLKYPVLFVLINIFFFYSGIIFIGKSFMKLMKFYQVSVSNNFMAHLLLYAAFYPSAFIIVPSLLREGSMIFFFGLCTFLLTDLYTQRGQHKRIKLYLFLSALVLLTLIRPIGGVSYMVAIFLFYLWDFWKKGKLKPIIIGLFSLGLFIFLINFIVDSFYNMSFSFSWIAQYRASHAELFGAEAYGTQLDWTGFLSSMKSSILLFLQYLFSPFPIIIPSEIAFQKIIPTIDASFILISMAPVIFITKTRPLKMILFFCFILLLIPAMFETHISGAYRHRMNAIVLLLPVFVYTMNKALFNLTKRK